MTFCPPTKARVPGPYVTTLTTFWMRAAPGKEAQPQLKHFSKLSLEKDLAVSH